MAFLLALRCGTITVADAAPDQLLAFPGEILCLGNVEIEKTAIRIHAKDDVRMRREQCLHSLLRACELDRGLQALRDVLRMHDNDLGRERHIGHEQAADRAAQEAIVQLALNHCGFACAVLDIGGDVRSIGVELAGRDPENRCDLGLCDAAGDAVVGNETKATIVTAPYESRRREIVEMPAKQCVLEILGRFAVCARYVASVEWHVVSPILFRGSPVRIS